MKKLLLILLLFFPVHSAWAEIFHLKCISAESLEDDTMFFKFDTLKKTVVNEGGNTIALTKVDPVLEWYSYRAIPKTEVTDEIRKIAGIEKGDLTSITNLTISRNTGYMVITLYIFSTKYISENYDDFNSGEIHKKLPGKELHTIRYSCIKTSGKKKF